MTIQVRFMSLQGKFTMVREETFAKAADALVAVKAHAEASGFTNVQVVDDFGDGSIRYTARTPGGRGGRNIAFGEYGYPGDEAPQDEATSVVHRPTVVETGSRSEPREKPLRVVNDRTVDETGF